VREVNRFAFKTKEIMKYLLVALVIMVISDGLVTNLLIGHGLAREGNPFLVTLVGDWVFLAIKAIGATLCAIILWDIHKHWPKLALIASSLFLLVYTGIVTWNLCLFFIG